MVTPIECAKVVIRVSNAIIVGGRESSDRRVEGGDGQPTAIPRHSEYTSDFKEAKLSP